MMSNVIRFSSPLCLLSALPASSSRVNITGRCTDPRWSSCRTKEGGLGEQTLKHKPVPLNQAPASNVWCSERTKQTIMIDMKSPTTSADEGYYFCKVWCTVIGAGAQRSFDPGWHDPTRNHPRRVITMVSDTPEHKKFVAADNKHSA